MVRFRQEPVAARARCLRHYRFPRVTGTEEDFVPGPTLPQLGGERAAVHQLRRALAVGVAQRILAVPPECARGRAYSGPVAFGSTRKMRLVLRGGRGHRWGGCLHTVWFARALLGPGWASLGDSLISAHLRFVTGVSGR